MRAGHRGVFDDRDLGVGRPEHHVAERSGDGELGAAARSAPRPGTRQERRPRRPRRDEIERLAAGDHRCCSGARCRFLAVKTGERGGGKAARGVTPSCARSAVRAARIAAPSRPSASRSRPRAMPPTAVADAASSPLRCEAAGGAGRCAGAARRHRPLLQDEPADAAPAVMGVDALDEQRREMLHFEGEGALDPHHQRGRAPAAPSGSAPPGRRGHSTLTGARMPPAARRRSPARRRSRRRPAKPCAREAGPRQPSTKSARGFGRASVRSGDSRIARLDRRRRLAIQAAC